MRLQALEDRTGRQKWEPEVSSQVPVLNRDKGQGDGCLPKHSQEATGPYSGLAVGSCIPSPTLRLLDFPGQ